MPARRNSARLFAALGDETRLRLVSRLCHKGPMSVTSLSGGFRVSRQAIAKHLRVMEDAGLAHRTRRGRESVWQLSPQRLGEARRHLGEISAQWDAALVRLKDLVER